MGIAGAQNESKKMSKLVWEDVKSSEEQMRILTERSKIDNAIKSKQKTQALKPAKLRQTLVRKIFL